MQTAGLVKQVGGRAFSYLTVRPAAHLHFLVAAQLDASLRRVEVLNRESDLFRLLISICAACCVSSTAVAQSLPWKSGDKPPVLAGFTLLENGDSARERSTGDIQVYTLDTDPGAAFAYTNTIAGYSVVISLSLKSENR